MDGAVVTRSHCAPCPSFVSFRVSVDVGTIGCDWGDDMTGWLRREMSRRDRNVPTRAVTRRMPASVERRRSGASFALSASFGVFLAAFGVGLAMSAFEKPS